MKNILIISLLLFLSLTPVLRCSVFYNLEQTDTSASIMPEAYFCEYIKTLYSK